MYLVKRAIDRQVSDLQALVGVDEVDLDEHDEMNLSPLHYAAWYNKPDAVHKLIQYGAGTYHIFSWRFGQSSTVHSWGIL